MIHASSKPPFHIALRTQMHAEFVEFISTINRMTRVDERPSNVAGNRPDSRSGPSASGAFS